MFQIVIATEKLTPEKMPKKMAEPNHIHSSKKTSKKYTALKADI